MATGITIRSAEPASIKPDTFQVFVDGEAAGVVSYTAPLELSLPPGAHSIGLKGAFFARSRSIEFFLRPDQHLEFECGTDYLGWYSRLGPLGVQLLGKEAIWVRHSDVSV